jgi:hypothetical protein
MVTEHQPPTDSISAQSVAADLQHVVQRKLGRCLIRLQQYENQLKAILVHQEVAGATKEQVEAHQFGRMRDVATQTLGKLIAQLTSSYLASEGTPAAVNELSGDASSDGVFFQVTLRMEMSSDDYTTTASKLKELVGLRNRLIHHFLDDFDIWSEEGCHAASAFLDDSYQRINDEFERLQAWAKTADQARAHAAEYFSSDEFKRELADQHLATEGSSVVRRLQSEVARSPDGWGNLGAFAASLAKLDPDETPVKYGCRSWRHFLHASRQFEIRRLPGTGRVLDRTLFRIRTKVPPCK